MSAPSKTTGTAPATRRSGSASASTSASSSCSKCGMRHTTSRTYWRPGCGWRCMSSTRPTTPPSSLSWPSGAWLSGKAALKSSPAFARQASRCRRRLSTAHRTCLYIPSRRPITYRRYKILLDESHLHHCQLVHLFDAYFPVTGVPRRPVWPIAHGAILSVNPTFHNLPLECASATLRVCTRGKWPAVAEPTR